MNNEYFTQSYICDSNRTAKIIIPLDATKNDLLKFKELVKNTISESKNRKK